MPRPRGVLAEDRARRRRAAPGSSAGRRRDRCGRAVARCQPQLSRPSPADQRRRSATSSASASTRVRAAPSATGRHAGRQRLVAAAASGRTRLVFFAQQVEDDGRRCAAPPGARISHWPQPLCQPVGQAPVALPTKRFSGPVLAISSSATRPVATCTSSTRQQREHRQRAQRVVADVEVLVRRRLGRAGSAARVRRRIDEAGEARPAPADQAPQRGGTAAAPAPRSRGGSARPSRCRRSWR